MASKFFLPFTRDECISIAVDRLNLPVAGACADVPPPKGKLVAQFVLPLELAPSENRTRLSGKLAWMNQVLRVECFDWMHSQCDPFDKPLPGLPQVRAVRLSTTAPDPLTHWAKLPIDKLQPDRVRVSRTTGKHTLIEGLGLIRDDTVKGAEQKQIWFPARMGKGFVYLEVRTG